MQGTLEHFRTTLNGVGWFIPPYITMRFLDFVCAGIRNKGDSFTQDDLEEVLAHTYSPENLAAMVTERYPVTPFVQDYKIIISEAVQAHFMGLDHVAVSGLMPVIEGVARKLAVDRQVDHDHIRQTFKNLAVDCKRDVIENEIGAVGELVSMLDSFTDFADTKLYIRSEKYPHLDMTNRNGILHGSYADENYGKPVNFYKAIAAIDFLCLVSAFKSKVSWMAPTPTEKSHSLALFYVACQQLSSKSPLKDV
ncbi:hypothetical protein CJT82_17120 [Pseudomonas aeruginosa]|uniref:hypothetical protein n=1 Tax=Pseudomonas aeruginosa TaxID=287 RepID=UPI000BB9BC2F|nr:hypothetical protein [Pseudomonas aeruginosa]PBX21128.1 hypothetical protein CJT83_27015 [Pseudomonas aeruginosa]PBX28904.1 hypothetical protein CJT82_17120 [Pseudomonas aeruginosa]HEK2500649.1 hypothetical protein [Pseudomonas aeruginosa]